MKTTAKPKVWITPLLAWGQAQLHKRRLPDYVCAKSAKPGDLILIYRPNPHQDIHSLWRLTSDPRPDRREHDDVPGWFANHTKIADLNAPISRRRDIIPHPELSSWGVARRAPSQPWHVHPDVWKPLRALIVGRNRHLSSQLPRWRDLT